jgi:glucosamine--fructose-6-phosphate aminotransferase (isomerizing)
MCGIVGYTGEKSATPVIFDGLKKLEYRGYDSAGCAVRSRLPVYDKPREIQTK